MSHYKGQQFGNYRLAKLLGEGGFAQVYRGEHIYLGTQAAIKVLTTRLTDNEIAQFRVEARTIMELEHPHIVRILDFGMQDRIPYIIMNYAPNGSLRDLHPKGTRLSPQTVVTYVKEIASALQYAHDRKLIHRDVKPDNLLIGRNNEVLLSDFGIATIAHSTHSLKKQDAPGTPYYNAPEQIQGKPRPASDQYALGVVAYEWLTGTWPFVGFSQIEIAMKHLQELPPSLREKVPTIPIEVEQVVLRSLSKDPHQRFESVRGFAEALTVAFGSAHEKRQGKVFEVVKLPKEDSRKRPEQAKAYLRAGEFNQALALYEEILRLDPQNTDAFYGMGWIYSKLGKGDKAIQAYDNAIRLEPKNFSSYFRKASLLGSPDEQVQVYDQIITLDSQKSGYSRYSTVAGILKYRIVNRGIPVRHDGEVIIDGLFRDADEVLRNLPSLVLPYDRLEIGTQRKIDGLVNEYLRNRRERNPLLSSPSSEEIEVFRKSIATELQLLFASYEKIAYGQRYGKKIHDLHEIRAEFLTLPRLSLLEGVVVFDEGSVLTFGQCFLGGIGERGTAVRYLPFHLIKEMRHDSDVIANDGASIGLEDIDLNETLSMLKQGENIWFSDKRQSDIKRSEYIPPTFTAPIRDIFVRHAAGQGFSKSQELTSATGIELIAKMVGLESIAPLL